MEGDDHGEAYTAIEWGVGLSLEILTLQGPRLSPLREGYMCGAAMRGADALPGSKATSRSKGARRNLGDLAWAGSRRRSGTRQEVEETKLSGNRRGVGRLHSTDEASNKAKKLVAERVEGRRPVEGKASDDACTGLGAGIRMSLKWRACANSKGKTLAWRASDLRQEPGAGKLHAGICGGGAGQPAPLPDKVHCDEGVATHVAPDPCAAAREDDCEASVGERIGQPLSRESVIDSGADVVHFTEGKTDRRVSASARRARRGLRPWHVRTLFAREPGDLWIGHRLRPGPEGPQREGEEP